MRAKDYTGLLGEEMAAEYLVQRGHRILTRRWRGHSGELDLVTLDDESLVAVEVKTRRGHGYGHPLEAVSSEKLHRLQRLLVEYTQLHDMKLPTRRVDVIGITLGRTGSGSSRYHVDYMKDVSL